MEDKDIKGFKQGLGKCRTCNHSMIAHYKNPKKSCLEAIPKNNDSYTRCACVLFKPIDNLEFLEWAADRKEKNG